MDISLPDFLKKNARFALSFSALADMAIEDARILGGKAEIVCGLPMGRGATSSYDLWLFKCGIAILQYYGRPIFSQMPYVECLIELEKAWRSDNPGAEHCMSNIDDFYGRLLTPTLFRRAWFVPGFGESHLARWQHDHFIHYGVEVRYLPKDWMFDLQLPTNLD